MLSHKRKSVRMSDPRFDEIVSIITKSYPKSCVLWIDEVENDVLLARYEQKKELLKNLYLTVEEFALFHGTKIDCIDPICEEGFRAELNRVSALGKGTYFATDALYLVDICSLIRTSFTCF